MGPRMGYGGLDSYLKKRFEKKVTTKMKIMIQFKTIHEYRKIHTFVSKSTGSIKSLVRSYIRLHTADGNIQKKSLEKVLGNEVLKLSVIISPWK